MNRRLPRLITSTALCAALAFTVAGCGSDDGTGGTGAAPDASSEAAPGAADAEAFLEENSDNPTSIGLDTPLPAAPETDKSLVALKFATGLGTRGDTAQQAAAEALGWDYSSIDAGQTPASAASAFEAAIAQKPDGILFGGFPAALFAKQIADAKAAGIVVVSTGTGDQSVDGVVADLAGAEQQKLFGKLAAAYFVTEAGSEGRAAVFNFQGFPISDLFSEAFVAQVEEWCPTCTAEIVQQQLADVGTKTPANVVGYLQREPETKYAVFASGDLSSGVTPALRTAGLQGINVLGIVPTEANLAALEAGSEAAWVGFPADVIGWRAIDIFARAFQDADVEAAAEVPLPLQMITKDNVGEILTDDGYYVGVEDYQDQFQKLWQTS